MIAKLEKALYGLRESPLLWYNELSNSLEEAGIDRTDEEPCVFTDGKILVLVYVDDILILSPPQEQDSVDMLVKHLQDKYDLREEDFKWYLGIRVMRDRPNRKIYLCSAKTPTSTKLRESSISATQNFECHRSRSQPLLSLSMMDRLPRRR
uniref:Reverse transcriptase Ty1/copia-type domain-containing protein n=1 Tax=Photinus pyralis TaxID=7054 RepID=A0A1Y1KB38_PHOPY